MLISVPPCAAYHCDSARVENRGPSMTTMVPPRRTSGAAATSASETRGQ